VTSVFTAIGRFSVRFRWLVVAAWVIAVFLTQGLLPSLDNVVQGNDQSFLPASAPTVHAGRLAAPFGATSEQPVPVVAARSGATLSVSDLAGLAALQGQLRTVPDVSEVSDLGRSPDSRAVELLAMVRISGGMMSAQSSDVVNAIRAKVSRAGLPAGLRVHVAGDLAAQVDNQTTSGTTANGLLNVAALFIIVLLMVIFRSLLAPLLTLAPAFLAVAISGPLVAEAAHHGLKVSDMAQLLLIVLVLGAGTDYGLFLVFRTREEMRGGLPARDAVVRAVARVGESITFSAATVIAALLSLLAATFTLYSDMALPLAIGIGVMLVAGLTLQPALLAVFGRAAFWPGTTRAGTGTPRAGAWSRIAGWVVRRPAVTLATGIILFAALAAASFGYKSGGFGGESAPAGTDSAAGNALLASHFPAAAANPTNLIFKLKAPAWAQEEAGAVATAGRKLTASGLFTGVTGPLDPAGVVLTPAQYTALHAQLGPAVALPQLPPAGTRVPVGTYLAYRATANYVSPDGLTVQFATGLAAGDPGGTAAINAVPAIRAETAAAAAVMGAADWGAGGQAPASYDIGSLSDRDLARVIPLAIVVIGVLLIVVMRSLVAPWYLIISVALSYFAALGVTVLLFIGIGGSSGLAFILPFLMFLFLLALGEDYNILVMTRIREEAHRLPLREAVARALSATGTTVTSAGLVLAGTFGVFAIVGGSGSGGSMVIDVGVGLAIGILMDTFLVRTLLVPSAVVLLGRWNWWPSRLSGRDRPAADRVGERRGELV